METTFYREYFELEDTHWWFVGRRTILLRMLDRYFGRSDDPSRRILDFGCGTGMMLEHLARYGTAEGVEASEEAISFCRARGLERVQRLEHGRLPFEDGAFDLVTALDVIEHVEDDLGLLRDLRRVARPGGTLLLTVPAFPFMWGPQDEISHHYRRYVAAGLRERMSAAGWKLSRLTYFNTLLFPPIAAVRVRRPPRPPGSELKSDLAMTRPGRLNVLLARLFSMEAPLVERRDLPFGVSLLAIATAGATGGSDAG